MSYCENLYFRYNYVVVYLLTQSRNLVNGMTDALCRTVFSIKEENLTGETICVIVGDAHGGDKFVIDLIDEINRDGVVIPLDVYGAYKKVRNKTQTGINHTLNGDFLARDRFMANLCDKCFACWNGIWNYNTVGRSGTVATAKYCQQLHKNVDWTHSKYNFVKHARRDKRVTELYFK